MERKIPGLLWVSIVALGIVTLGGLVMGLSQGSLAIGVSGVLNAVLLVGLVLGWRWAFVLIIVFSGLGTAVALGGDLARGLSILIGNAIVVVPMIVERSYFFGEKRSDPGEQSVVS